MSNFCLHRTTSLGGVLRSVEDREKKTKVFQVYGGLLSAEAGLGRGGFVNVAINAGASAHGDSENLSLVFPATADFCELLAEFFAKVSEDARARLAQMPEGRLHSLRTEYEKEKETSLERWHRINEDEDRIEKLEKQVADLKTKIKLLKAKPPGSVAVDPS